MSLKKIRLEKTENHPCARVLVVDDDTVVRAATMRMLDGLGFLVREAEAGEQAFQMMGVEPFDIVLLDIAMPRMNGIEALKRIHQTHPFAVVIMLTDSPSIDNAIECIKLGAAHYLEKPFNTDELRKFVLKAKQLIEKRREQGKKHIIIGDSKTMQKVKADIRRVANTDSTVLITGQSGTGKELVAHTIHNQSRRADYDCVPVECSTLAESLLESELFGHVKGAFTGANENRPGLFEQANQGTFFFDEITNISLEIQAKLLRVIQEREFMMVGSRKRKKLDIRIIAASNHDMMQEVERGSFREDLYYRLNVVPIHLPSLRERPEDIGLLVEYFIRKHNNGSGYDAKKISDEVLEKLMAYAWPGNVRELENLIERILVLEDDDVIQLRHIPPRITKQNKRFNIHNEEEETLADIEKRYIQYIFRRTNGRRHQAAGILGINRKTLTAKIKKYGLQ